MKKNSNEIYYYDSVQKSWTVKNGLDMYELELFICPKCGQDMKIARFIEKPPIHRCWTDAQVTCEDCGFVGIISLAWERVVVEVVPNDH